MGKACSGYLAHLLLLAVVGVDLHIQGSRGATHLLQPGDSGFRTVLHLPRAATDVALPLSDLVAIALVAHVPACALALLAHPRAHALACLTLRRALAATPLALAPLVLDFHAAISAAMGADDIARALTHVASHLLLAQAEVALAPPLSATEGARALLQSRSVTIATRCLCLYGKNCCH